MLKIHHHVERYVTWSSRFSDKKQQKFKILPQGSFPGLAHAVTLRLCFTNFPVSLLNISSCTKFFPLLTSVSIDLFLITLVRWPRNITKVAIYVLHQNFILLLLQFLLLYMVRDLFIIIRSDTLCNLSSFVVLLLLIPKLGQKNHGCSDAN